MDGSNDSTRGVPAVRLLPEDAQDQTLNGTRVERVNETMARAETGSTRLPRGTKPVIQGFFTALEAVPESQRPLVAAAAQAAIRDELKLRRDKSKANGARAKAATGSRATAKAAPAAARKVAKAPPATPTPEPKPSGRGRKPKPREDAE